jgi:hypothetical protein
MGAGQSSSRGEPIVVYEDRPIDRGLDGISFSSALACERCQLSVAKGISTSSVTIYRESGMVTNEECALFSRDFKRVQQKQMAFREFKRNLQAGKYLRGI